jgi:hypothetical protein
MHLTMKRAASVAAPILAFAALAFVAAPTVACGGNDEPYKPAPAWSGRKASLPAPPALQIPTIKAGDSYTVNGAIHQLHSRVHEKEVNGKEITVTGYVVDSNIPLAPMCAVHKTGKKDPDDCKDIPIPSFAITDVKDDPKGSRIRVMGWASNFANVYDAMQKYRGRKEPPKELQKDEVWGIDVPFPLPANGAKVRVTGRYGYTFAKSSQGLVSDPAAGILTYTKIEVLEPAPAPAQFAKPI